MPFRFSEDCSPWGTAACNLRRWHEPETPSSASPEFPTCLNFMRYSVFVVVESLSLGLNCCAAMDN